MSRKRSTRTKHRRGERADSATSPPNHLGRARWRRRLVALSVVAGALLGGYVWFHFHNDSRQSVSTVPKPLPLGAPPVNAATTLGLAESLPQTVSDYNAEILAVGQSLVESLPEQPESYGQMAMANLAVGQDAEAIQCWHDALAKNDRYARALMGIGTQLAESGENDEAADYLQRAVDCDEGMESAYQLLVEVQLRQGNTEEALTTAKKCVEQFPEDHLSHFWLGQAELEAGDYEAARQSHEEALKLDPQWSQSHYALARVHARLGNAEKALQHRQEFAALKKSEMAADRDRTRTFDDLAERRQATVKRHVLASVLQIQFQHPKMAEAHWLRAAAIASEDTATREALTRLYQQQQRRGAELQILAELIPLQPDQFEPRFRKGELLIEIGSFAEAQNVFEHVLELNPDSIDAHARLAHLFLLRGKDLAMGRKHAEQAVRLGPSAATLSLLASLRAQCGDYDGARDALRKAAKLDPANVQVRQALEQMCNSR